MVQNPYKRNIKDKTDRLNRHCKQSGLNINSAETQVMCINTTPSATTTIDDEPLKFVETFTSLGSLVSEYNDGAQKNNKLR